VGVSSLIVLDTHVWVWWLSDPDNIPNKARKLIAEAASDRAVYISSISAWEIALLVKKDRLRFTMEAADWIARSEALPFLHFVPVDNAIAVRSVVLIDPFKNDPADRIIVATAIIMGAPLVSSDRRILKYPHVKTVWK
jgi:PIN domain nuclease of toxin-antitoxin system